MLYFFSAWYVVAFLVTTLILLPCLAHGKLLDETTE